MTLQVSADELAELVVGSKVVCRKWLLDAVRRSRLGAAATSTAVASEMLPAFRVRLKRWQETGIPSSEGIPEFVGALEELGDRVVVVTDYHDGSMNFALLFSADFARLLAAIRFHDPYPEGPEDSSAATGKR
jgi:hypothetical protein